MEYYYWIVFNAALNTNYWNIVRNKPYQIQRRVQPGHWRDPVHQLQKGPPSILSWMCHCMFWGEFAKGQKRLSVSEAVSQKGPTCWRGVIAHLRATSVGASTSNWPGPPLSSERTWLKTTTLHIQHSLWIDHNANDLGLNYSSKHNAGELLCISTDYKSNSDKFLVEIQL